MFRPSNLALSHMLLQLCHTLAAMKALSENSGLPYKANSFIISPYYQRLLPPALSAAFSQKILTQIDFKACFISCTAEIKAIWNPLSWKCLLQVIWNHLFRNSMK